MYEMLISDSFYNSKTQVEFGCNIFTHNISPDLLKKTSDDSLVIGETCYVVEHSKLHLFCDMISN